MIQIIKRCITNKGVAVIFSNKQIPILSPNSKGIQGMARTREIFAVECRLAKGANLRLCLSIVKRNSLAKLPVICRKQKRPFCSELFLQAVNQTIQIKDFSLAVGQPTQVRYIRCNKHAVPSLHGNTLCQFIWGNITFHASQPFHHSSVPHTLDETFFQQFFHGWNQLAYRNTNDITDIHQIIRPIRIGDKIRHALHFIVTPLLADCRV